MLKICAGYWLLLTASLVSSNPLKWFGGERSITTAYNQFEPISHLVSFFLLTLLALAARWPVSRIGLVALLAAYGVATELVQSQVPGRRMQFVDIIQDLAGIAVGCVLFWAWQRLTTRPLSPALPPAGR